VLGLLLAEKGRRLSRSGYDKQKQCHIAALTEVKVESLEESTNDKPGAHTLPMDDDQERPKPRSVEVPWMYCVREDKAKS